MGVHGYRLRVPDHEVRSARNNALFTGIPATELTPEAPIDAYENQRLIATSGQFVFMDVRVAGGLP